jgi:hypothetical protein
MTARLATGFWVAAYRARLEAAGIPAVIAAKGDPVAGAVLVKLATLDGAARLFAREPDAGGDLRWTVVAEGAEPTVDDAAARRRRVDPDVWLVEIEDRRGRTLLDEPGLDG